MKSVSGILCGLLLAGCASHVTSLAGQNLAKGVIQPAPTAQAVRVGAKANLLHQGKRLKFDVWIEADSGRGRLDALGPFGTPLATVIWEDSAWKAWMPGQSTLLRGYGNSVNLPVLGIKEINPSSLVAPLLGRVFPRRGPIRTVDANPAQTLVLPRDSSPTWSLLVDKSTGLPQHLRTMQAGREIEGLTFDGWLKQGEILVPAIIDRTTPDGQLLQLEVGEWNSIPSIPAEHLRLVFHSPVDTITLARNERGQTVYRIRAATAGGDSTSVILSGQQVMEAAPFEDAMTPEDSLDQDDESDITDSAALDEASETTDSDSVSKKASKSTRQPPGVQTSDKPRAIIPDKRERKP